MRLTKEVTRTFYVPNDPDKGSVVIRHLKHSDVQAITGEIETVTYDPRTRGSIKAEFNPWEKLKSFAHASIVSWANFKDEIGRPLDFNSINLNRVAELEVEIDVEGTDQKTSFGFYMWIEKCRNELASDVEKEAAAAKGN